MITYNGFSLNHGGMSLIPKNTTLYSGASFKPYPNVPGPIPNKFTMQWWDVYAIGESGPEEVFTTASYLTNGVSSWELSTNGVVSEQLPIDYEYMVNFDYNDRLETLRQWWSGPTGTGTENFSAYYTITTWDWIKEMKVMDCNYCSGVYYQLPNCTDLAPNFMNTDNLVSFGGDYPAITGKLEPVITKLISLGVSADNSDVHTFNQTASGAPFRNSTGAQDYAHCVTAYPNWFN
jgi:hypothetical protein